MNRTTLSTKDKTFLGNDVQKIEKICGVECYEKDGTAYLKLETVARGLGFTHKESKNGKVVYHRKITQLGRKFILGKFENVAWTRFMVNVWKYKFSEYSDLNPLNFERV